MRCRTTICAPPLSSEARVPKPLIPGPWRVEILASDINYSVLRTAQEGSYSEHQMAGVDYGYRLRYFDKVGERYAVKKGVKELVHFDFHNLKTEYLPQRNDIIFCRNVMMYFDEAEQKRLVEKFYRCLNPQGYMFVGHAESLLGLTEKFQMVHRNSGTAYQRVEVRNVTVPPEDRMSELRQLFFETAAELVQKLNDEAMQLEKSPGDAETARSLRRTVHTLKGDSAACGFRELSELCHEFEDVLTLGNTAAAAVPEIALRAADVFAALLEAYQKGTKLPSIQSLRADIARLAHPARDGAGKAPQKKKKAAAKTSRWSEYEQLAMTRAVAMGKRVHHVVVEIDPQCAMPIAGRQMIQLALAELGEVLALYPAEGSLDPIKQIEAALVSEKPVEQIRAKCNIPTIALNAKVKALRVPAPLAPLPQASAAASEGSATEGTNEAALPAPAAAAAGDTARCPVNDANHANDVPAAAEPAAASGVPSGPDNLLRVDAEKIDSVLNLVGELILAKSMLQQALLEFGERFPKDGLRGKFADAMVFQGRVLNDLQHAVMKIRMVPVDQLFRRFPRIVRDVARQCGKEVELTIKGGQTDLDKSILDAIAEPMTHLVRNAIGHGIENGRRAGAGRQTRAGDVAAGRISPGEPSRDRGLRRWTRHRWRKSKAARPRPGIAERRPGGSPDRGGDSGSDLAAGLLHGGGDHGNFGPRRGLGCGAERARRA